MSISLSTTEKKEKRRLELQSQVLQTKIIEATVVKNLYVMRKNLGIREQDVWLLRIALLNNVPSSEIKNFQFSKTGDLEIGGDHEPTTPSVAKKISSRAEILDRASRGEGQKNWQKDKERAREHRQRSHFAQRAQDNQKATQKAEA